MFEVNLYGTLYGLLLIGLKIPPFDVLRQMIEDDLKAIFGDGIDLTPNSKFGQMRDIRAEREYNLWQLLQAVYSSYDPELSSGQALERNSQIVGVYKQKAQRSWALVTLSGNQGTQVDKSSLIEDQVSGVQFRLTETVIIGAGPTSLDISGNPAQVESLEYGLIPALAGNLNLIKTPVAGWTSVSNPSDATVGRLEETDTQLRVRREQSLVSGGNGKADAIKAAIQKIAGVATVTYFENDTDQVDARGQLAHSLEFFVIGGVDQEIANIMWTKRGTYARWVGNVSVPVTDSESYQHQVQFSRPLVKNIYITVDLTVGVNYPTGGDAQVITNLLNRGAKLGIGDDVILDPYLKGALSDVVGILGSVLKIGLALNPTLSVNIPIDVTELASFDSTRITLNHV